jgi:hypothetical protein
MGEGCVALCGLFFFFSLPMAESCALPMVSPCFFQIEEERPSPAPDFTCGELGLLLLSGP